MLFSDMPYVRPDLDFLREKIDEHLEELKNAPTFADADKAYIALEKVFSGVETAGTLCYIRHSLNTEDEFYAAEQEFLDEARPQLQEIQQQAQLALYDSPWRPDFERKYGTLLFKNLQIALRSFDPKLIPDMPKENKLVTAYAKLIASAQIPFEGGTYTPATTGQNASPATYEEPENYSPIKMAFIILPDDGDALHIVRADVVAKINTTYSKTGISLLEVTADPETKIKYTEDQSIPGVSAQA